MFTQESFLFFLNTYIRMFFLLAPFLGASMFVAMSEGLERPEKRKAAIRTSIAVAICIFVMFFFGKPVFYLLGITLPAFQIGAGSTLFVSSLMMVLGLSKKGQYTDNPDDDFAVVPLAIPLLVGPGTIGTVLVWGNEFTGFANRTAACLAFACSSFTIFLLLFFSDRIQQFLGQKVLSILIKITALILTALAAQIIFTGIKSFLG